MLLGDSYARNLGLNIKRARLLVITCGGPYGDCHGLLRTYYLLGASRSAFMPGHISNFRPSDFNACGLIRRCGVGVDL